MVGRSINSSTTTTTTKSSATSKYGQYLYKGLLPPSSTLPARMGRSLIQRHFRLQSCLLPALFLLDTANIRWLISFVSSPVQLTPRILFHLPRSSWPYRSAICMCTESTYSHISRMIALRKQTGQYTNDLVSMHTNASTILRRLWQCCFSLMFRLLV